MLGDSLKWLTVLACSAAWRFHERRLDIVHLTDPYTTPALPGFFVATINDIFPITQIQYRNSDIESQYFCRTPILLRKANTVFTPSHYIAETLHSKYPSCSLDIVPVHDAASVSFRQLAPNEELLGQYGLSANSYFLFIGRVDPHCATEIASAMKAMTDTAGIRSRFISRGFDQVKFYSWKMTAKRTMGVYRNALRNKGEENE